MHFEHDIHYTLPMLNQFPFSIGIDRFLKTLKSYYELDSQ